MFFMYNFLYFLFVFLIGMMKRLGEMVEEGIIAVSYWGNKRCEIAQNSTGRNNAG